MKSNPIKKTEADALIRAGLEARELRKQLAVTWLASQEIIDVMRALRKGIVIPEKVISENDPPQVEAIEHKK
jgi:hypothetical protein